MTSIDTAGGASAQAAGSRARRAAVAALAASALLVTTGAPGVAGPTPAAPGLAAKVPAIDLPLEKYALPNGLEVILAQDKRLPTVTTNLWYHVGAADEGPAPDGSSRTGFAHLFEHMMFQGSGHVPEGKYDEIVEGLGANFNASTNFDYTNYYIADLPSDRLETALWLESDRMGFLLDRLSASSLANQQAVVRNERRQRTEQAPYGLSDEELFHQLFPADHPYYGSVIGSHADIQAANLEDVRKFFKTYYVPNNASLVVAGNFDKARAKKLIAKYFGPLPKGAEPPKPKITVPKITAEKRVVVADEVELEKVTIGWLTDPFFTSGDSIADVTGTVLGGGESSRLYSTLVREKKIAQAVSAYQLSASHPSVFVIEALAKPGHTAAELEKAIDAELAAQAKDGPAAEDLTIAKAGFASSLVRQVEGVGNRANLVNLFNHFTGKPGHLNDYIGDHEAVAPADVKAFVADTLRKDARVVVHTVPGKKVLPPDPAAPPAPAAAKSTGKSKEPWRNKAPGPGPAPTVAVPGVRRFTLANGLPVYLVPSHKLPVVAASVVSRYGSSMDPDGQAGLANFTAAMLRQGAEGRNASEIAREIARLGATLETTARRDGSWVTVSALTPQAGKALELAASLVRGPTFPKADVARVRDDLLVGLQTQASDPGATAAARLQAAVYGGKHAYGHLPLGTRAGVSKLGRAELKRFHAQAFNPANVALVLAGDLTVPAARKLASKAFGSWKGKSPAPPVPGPGKPAAERVVLVDVPGAGQTSLAMGQPGLPRSHPDFERLQVANQVLGGLGLSNRLMLNLRETRGYTYGMYSTLAYGRGPAPFDMSGAVQTQHTGDSVRQMLVEARRIRDTELTADELRRAKDSLAGEVPQLFQTSALSVRAVRDLFLYGLEPDHYKQLPARLAPLTAAQVRAAATKHLRPGRMKIVAVGDRATVDKQLRELKLGKIAYRNADGSVAKTKPTPKS